jgi:hypothetical protein
VAEASGGGSDIPASDEELDKLMKPVANNLAVFQIGNEPAVQQRNAFKPYYSFVELERYRMYFDSRKSAGVVVGAGSSPRGMWVVGCGV